MFGEGELNKNAVNLRVFIQTFDKVKKFFLGYCLGIAQGCVLEAHFIAVLRFTGHV